MRPEGLLRTFLEMVYIDLIPLTTALSLFTRNVAAMLNIKSSKGAGVLRVGGVADMLVLDLPLRTREVAAPPEVRAALQFVIASGKVLKCPAGPNGDAVGVTSRGSWVKRGMFEDAK